MKKIRYLLAGVTIVLFVSLSTFAYNITGWMFNVGFLPEFPVTVNGQE
ncbi:MAG: hypothetical protein IJZ20_01680 [Clostridia bacterium]|nr:hypothetical protein [Clostridia bacterium]